VLTQLAVSQTITTFYFRVTFVYTGETAGLRLFATNLVDDGAVIYLNGLRAAQVRLAAQNPFATTLANGGPAVEGQLDVVELVMAEPLRSGTNQIAVEVHQSMPTSNDIMWGMKLAAVRDTPLSIASPPESAGVFIGGSAQFSVEVSGGPVAYRWYRKTSSLILGTNAALSILNAQLTMAGDYYVVVSNSINSVTSSVASLTVLPDTAGPRALEAVVIPSGNTNIIQVVFDEVLPVDINSPNRNTNNFRLLVAGTVDQFVAITTVQLTAGGIILRLGGGNWVIGGDYELIINNVVDRYTNAIAPDTRIAVGWPKRGMAFFVTEEWSYHASARFDPAVYDEDWTGTNYLERFPWGRGWGLMCGSPLFESTCVGGCSIETGPQSEPTLFRTTFLWPDHWPAKAVLTPRIVFDDGFVLYLNGREILRSNVPPSVAKMTPAVRATANTAIHCATNLSVAVTNLLSGTNWLAVVAVDFGGDGVQVFALELEAAANVAPMLVEDPAPRIEAAPLDGSALWLAWDGHGYTLESVTNLTDNAASAPLGPWQQVPRLTNPYTNSLAGPSRFFRLRK